MIFVIQIAAAATIALMAAGSALSLSTHPHWFVRGWDFPRLQIVALTTLMAAIVASLQGDPGAMSRGLLAATLAIAGLTIAFQLYSIGRFTVFLPRRVHRTPKDRLDEAARVCIVCTNVEMGSRQYDRWLEVISRADPDVVLAVEVDDGWVEATRSLQDRYAHRVVQSQDNCYGMMLLSRLPLEDTHVDFLVQKDIPSIRATLVMRSGSRIRLRGLHPRPPDPIRDVDSDHRDAELMVVGRQVERDDLPTIVCGDLNDVAWSRTTRLFLRISRLLDPREGRGLYNTWHARHRLIRFPLDHLFHADEFTLRRLERLAYTGSDHFPILVDLQHTPRERVTQSAPPKQADDQREARSTIETEARRSPSS